MQAEGEQTLLRFFGLKLIAFKTLKDGEIIGTGLLNPILEKLGLFTMLYFQTKFYRQYENLARWKGKRVTNPFAPPVFSRPQFRALKALVKSHLFKTPFPVAMTFAVTYRCQCRCHHCSAARHLRKDTEELNTEEAKRVIDESQDIGVSVIAFTGGEPLLRKDIFELISYVDQKKAMPMMFTNGLLLNNNYVKRLVDAGLYSLFLSLDSPLPEEHDQMRGVHGLFDTAVEGLMKIKGKGVLVALSSYATKNGTEKGDYKKMYKLAQELGTHTLVLFDNVPTGNLIKDVRDVLTQDQRREIVEFTSHIFKHSIMPPLSSQAWQTSLEGYLGGIGCVAGCLQYYVSAYGDVAPCDFTPLSFGNLRKEPLKKIWKRIKNHPAYNHRTQFCRMQNPKFRRFYIDPIPDDEYLPYGIEKLPRVDYRKEPVR